MKIQRSNIIENLAKIFKVKISLPKINLNNSVIIINSLIVIKLTKNDYNFSQSYPINSFV